jgi:hypothetical protein
MALVVCIYLMHLIKNILMPIKHLIGNMYFLVGVLLLTRPVRTNPAHIKIKLTKNNSVLEKITAYLMTTPHPAHLV